MELAYNKSPFLLPLIFAPQALLHAFRHTPAGPARFDLVGGLFVGLACFLVALPVILWAKRGFSGRRLVIDSEGVWFLRSGGYGLPWSQIRACAGEITPFRRTLRLFLRSGARLRAPRGVAAKPGAAPTLDLGAKDYIDIDLLAVARSTTAVDAAVAACARHLARDNGVADPEAFIASDTFKDSSREGALQARFAKFFLIALALVLAVATAVAVVAISKSPIGG